MSILSEKTPFEQDSIKSIEIFCKQFEVGKALKESNAYKEKGIPVVALLKYLLTLIFIGKSFFADLRSKHPLVCGFGKDTVYRFMNRSTFNWPAFLLNIGLKLTDFFDSLTSSDRMSAMVIDDSVYHRPYSKKMELASKVYDHAASGSARYKVGFRMLTLGWTDGFSFVPLSFRHLSSADEKNRYSEASTTVDKRTCGGKLRKDAVVKATDMMITLLEKARKSGIKAKHVLFDSWFAHPVTICAIDKMNLFSVCRVKNSSKQKFMHNGEMMSTKEIYSINKKRHGRSRYLLSADITVCDKERNMVNAKLVYIRDRGNRKKWIALLSTDTGLTEEDIIALYGKRWDIEVFFKMCKSYLALAKEFQQLSYDAVTAHTTIVMLRYMMLSYEKRKSNDPRSFCEHFYMFFDEASDIKYEQALLLIMQTLSCILRSSRIGLTNEQIDMILEAFMLEIPEYLRICLTHNSKNTA